MIPNALKAHQELSRHLGGLKWAIQNQVESPTIDLRPITVGVGWGASPVVDTQLSAGLGERLARRWRSRSFIGVPSKGLGSRAGGLRAVIVAAQFGKRLDELAQVDRRHRASAASRRCAQMKLNASTAVNAWGEFAFHVEANGRHADPHLHAYCFVQNVMLDAEEQRWKVEQFCERKADASYYEALFHSRLGASFERARAVDRAGRQSEQQTSGVRSCTAESSVAAGAVGNRATRSCRLRHPSPPRPRALWPQRGQPRRMMDDKTSGDSQVATLHVDVPSSARPSRHATLRIPSG